MKEKKKNEKNADFLEQEAEEFEKTAPEYTLDIPEEEIWTYQIEGLAAPRIGKPEKNAATKKVILIVCLLIAIAMSIWLSLKAIHNDTYDYDALADGTYQLSKFSNPGSVTTLTIDFVDGDTAKPITQIRDYAFNCDEMITSIRIGAGVTTLSSKSFYSCQALRRILVDPDNPAYCDMDGVLYSKDMTQLICRPIDYDAYLEEKFGYAEQLRDKEHPVENLIGTSDAFDDAFLKQYNRDVRTYVVPSTVKTICEMALNYADITDLYLPEGLEQIETLAVFKCTSLQNIYSYTCASPVTDTSAAAIPALGKIYPSLPDGLTDIGSDAFSYNQSLTYMYIPASVKNIGHHAFWDTCYKQSNQVMGVTCMHIALSREAFEASAVCGDQWCPKYDYKMFKKTIDIEYGAQREQL